MNEFGRRVSELECGERNYASVPVARPCLHSESR
jgi:hypothetical protein